MPRRAVLAAPLVAIPWLHLCRLAALERSREAAMEGRGMPGIVADLNIEFHCMANSILEIVLYGS